jgi:alpha-ketoglutarate-dependent 2,4-dichlorophenoxyacetate dioxygenase
MPLTIKPLHPTFAAEVRGVDIASGVDEDAIQALACAIDRYAVVVLPDQDIDDRQHVAFTARFGEIEPSVTRYRPDNAQRIATREIVDVSNLDENGRPRPMHDRLRMMLLGNRLWHTDSSFRQVPGALSMLHGRIIPPSGGETEFCDLRSAYERLPGWLRERIESATAVHSLMHSREQLGFSDFSPEERAALPPVEHPMVRTSPADGRKALYMGSHASHIVGLPVPEGRMLLRDLLDHATRREFVYSHSWRANDLVIWDNRCTLHRGMPFDETHPRDVRRVTTSHTVERSVLDQVRALASQPAVH